MLTEYRQFSRRDYMRDYRQGLRRRVMAGKEVCSARYEQLKEAHRFHSFKWRFARLLGSQYDVLFCVQYKPETLEDGLPWYESGDFPVFDWFWDYCYAGGGEIFRLFLFIKVSRRNKWFTPSLVGVLDKAALLKSLQDLTGRKRKEFHDLIEKLEAARRKERWHILDASHPHWRWHDGWLWSYKGDIYLQLLKWTARKRPDWRDTELRHLLAKWLSGHRRAGVWDRFEIQEVGGGVRRGLFSPIFGKGA